MSVTLAPAALLALFSFASSVRADVGKGEVCEKDLFGVEHCYSTIGRVDIRIIIVCSLLGTIILIILVIAYINHRKKRAAAAAAEGAVVEIGAPSMGFAQGGGGGVMGIGGVGIGAGARLPSGYDPNEVGGRGNWPPVEYRYPFGGEGVNANKNNTVLVPPQVVVDEGMGKESV